MRRQRGPNRTSSLGLSYTAVACLTLRNPPTDVVEMLTWGKEWSWGYHTHPPLPAWYLLSRFCRVALPPL